MTLRRRTDDTRVQSIMVLSGSSELATPRSKLAEAHAALDKVHARLRLLDEAAARPSMDSERGLLLQEAIFTAMQEADRVQRVIDAYNMRAAS